MSLLNAFASVHYRYLESAMLALSVLSSLCFTGLIIHQVSVVLSRSSFAM